MCCPANQEQMRAALHAGRERELGLRELVSRLFGRPAREPVAKPSDGPSSRAAEGRAAAG